MSKYLLAAVVLCIVLNTACKKEVSETSVQRKRTTVSGHLLRKYSRRPVAGYTILLKGERPHEPCLFCPSTYTDDLGETVTDSNGYYKMSIDTTDIYTSMNVGSRVYYYTINVGSDNQGVNIDEYESIVLRETFHVFNNIHLPVFVQGPFYFQTVKVVSRDTTFTTFNIAQPNERIGNNCNYTDSAGKTHTLYLPYATQDFVDTLQLNFEVDGSSF